jgi:hypothetical protein
MAVAIAPPDVPELPAEPEAPLAAAEPEVPAHEPARRAAVAPIPEAEVVSIAMPLSAIERLAMAGPRIRRRDHLLTTAWAASFAALAAMGVAGYTQRDMLMRQWPASVRVYSALGMAPLAMHATDPGPAR